MSKPFAAYESLNRPTNKGSAYRHIIATRVIPEYRPDSSKANTDGWVYHKFALHATKGWRKV